MNIIIHGFYIYKYLQKLYLKKYNLLVYILYKILIVSKQVQKALSIGTKFLTSKRILNNS